jgi:hypothetical protein
MQIQTVKGLAKRCEQHVKQCNVIVEVKYRKS